MSAFGPFYPAVLQRTGNHAERLAQMLAARLSTAGLDGEAAAWIIGRDEEIERFVELVVADWVRRRFSDEQASAVLESYLAALHDGLVRRLGMASSPCCLGPSAMTALPPRPDSVTREHSVTRPPVGGHVTSVDSVVSVDGLPDTAAGTT